MVMPLASWGRTALSPFLAAALLCLGSCAGPEYWIDGLTLPPRSLVVDRVETDTPRAVPGLNVPMMGEFGRALTVSFDNLAGWKAVSLHIDRCLQDQGYTQGIGDLDRFLDSLPGAGSSTPGISRFMRLYTRKGGRYMVVLYSAEDIAEQSGAPAGSTGSAEFVLQVMRFR